jgi:phospholipase/lecithinase/hemolysin
MKMFKCMTVALLALLPLAAGTVFADTGHGYSRMFVFGASFLDPGNHFAVTGETAHPPFDPTLLASYGIGGHHFSNGRTWVEVMAQDMDLTEWAKPAYRDPAYGNYAYGYVRARPVDYPSGPGLGDQVQAWIDNGYCTFAPMNDTLFVLDSSFADFLDIFEGADPTVVIGGMVDSIASNIGILYGCGARNLMVANAPPVGAAPGVPAPNKAAATGLSFMYNLYVQDVLDVYSGEPFNMNITTVDIFAFFTEVLTNQETYGFANVAEPCIAFGVRKNAFCKDRDGYLFWDLLHPTKKAYAMMGEFALEYLPALD